MEKCEKGLVHHEEEKMQTELICSNYLMRRKERKKPIPWPVVLVWQHPGGSALLFPWNVSRPGAAPASATARKSLALS